MCKFFAINLSEHLVRLSFIIKLSYIALDQCIRVVLIFFIAETCQIRLVVVTFCLICLCIRFVLLLLNCRHFIIGCMCISSAFEAVDNLLLQPGIINISHARPLFFYFSVRCFLLLPISSCKLVSIID